MQHLSEGKWVQLTFLSLGSHALIAGRSKIGNKSCKFLTKGPWKHLTTLYLCILSAIEVDNEI